MMNNQQYEEMSLSELLRKLRSISEFSADELVMIKKATVEKLKVASIN
ncbi:hypothetical protein NOVO_02080 [Rickettsiales bacterium Ac37b]|nr:hypothetical protein NOVO_02080 [Rickettsiales bacterium Ac37b]